MGPSLLVDEEAWLPPTSKLKLSYVITKVKIEQRGDRIQDSSDARPQRIGHLYRKRKHQCLYSKKATKKKKLKNYDLAGLFYLALFWSI